MDEWGDRIWRRLQAAARGYGTQEQLAQDSGIPKPTLQKILSGKVEPGVSRVARLAGILGVSMDYLLTGKAAGQPDTVEIPIDNLIVSAGPGTVALEEGLAEQSFAFPRQWLTTSFGQPEGLRIVRIEGDSQDPELRHGDWLMIDVRRRALANGFHVVRLDDYLMIKRVQIEGRFVRLMSANPAYPPIEVDLKGDESRLGIIGKAVWAGRMI